MGIIQIIVGWSVFLCSSSYDFEMTWNLMTLWPEICSQLCLLAGTSSKPGWASWKKHFLLLSLLLQILCILLEVSFYIPKTDIAWFMYLFLMHFSGAKSSPLHKGWKKWLFLFDLILFLQISFLPSVLNVFWCKFVKLELKFILLQYVVVSLSTAFRVRAASVKVLKSSLGCSMSAVARAGNAAVPRSKTAISTVSRAMLPILLVLLKNTLFSCFIAPSVAHWQWWLLLLLLRESLSCFSVENWILDKIVLLEV